MLNPQTQIKNLKKSFIDYSLQNIERTKNYYKKLNIENKNTGVFSTMNYDFEKNQKDDYNNILQRTTYLQNQMIASNSNFVGFFITLTLPSKYHPFLKVGKKHVHNPHYDNRLTINGGYKKLNKMMRKIQKDMKVNGKKQTIKFIKVIEYHKSFVPHLHAVVFVNEDFVEQFKKHLIKIFGADIEHIEKIKGFKNGKYTNKTIYKKNENIGRSEVEQLENIERAVAYLLKYIKKSLNADNIFDKHLLDGWKKKNKIRIFTMSNVSIPRYVYKKLYINLGRNIEKNETKEFNILEQFEKICDINIKTYFENDLISDRNIGTKNSRYIISIEKEKIVKEFYEDFEISEEDIENLELEEEEIEEKISYRIDEFIIFDTKTNKEIYNKKDYIVHKVDITENDFVEEQEYSIELNKIIKKDIQVKDSIKILKDKKRIKVTQFDRAELKKYKKKEKEEIEIKRIQQTFNFDFLNDPLCHSCNIKINNKVS